IQHIRYHIVSHSFPTRRSTDLSAILLDSVVGMEVFETDTLVGKTILASTAATALTVVASAGVAVAIFGSCPTIYSDSGGVPRLRSEEHTSEIQSLAYFVCSIHL